MSVWTRNHAKSAQPIVIGHRGAPDIALENTRESFRRAMASGAGAVETDVHLTADQQVVCLHDADLLRVAGSPAKIAEITLDDARALFPALLRFEEFLDFTRGFPVIVDVKNASGDDLDAFLPLVHRHNALNRSLFTAYTPEIARMIRDRLPDAVIGTFFPEGGDCLAMAAEIGAKWIRVLPKDYQADTIERIQTAGFRTVAVAAPLSSFKTASDGAALSEIARLKIDAVITDTPEFAAKHYARQALR